MDKETLEKQERWKAGMHIKSFRQRSGIELTYDEAIEIAELAAETAEDVGPQDHTFEHFARQAHEGYKLAWAINVDQQLGRTDHLQMVPVIISYAKGSVTEETQIPLQKPVGKLTSDTTFKSAAYEALIRRGVAHKLLFDLEVIKA